VRSVNGRLTPDELHTLQLLAMGRRHSEIARELYISISAVRGRLDNVRAQLNAATATHAVAIAMRDGLIAGPEADRQQN
jgi:DNA-binding NarL/FixJ family response regulator